jgi:uncharacterized protein DUF5666
MYNRREFAGRLAVIGGIAFALPVRNWAQQAAHSRSGIAIAIDGDKIYVSTDSGPLTVKPKPSTRIWKGEYSSKIDVIRPGDDLAMRGVVGPDGSFVPSDIWVNITVLDGVVKSIEGTTIEVDAIRNDSVSETKTVKLTDGTLSSQNIPLKKEVVQVGRIVQVIGLALEDGSIQATRVRVYVNGRLLDATGTKYVDPRTGAIVDKP